MITYTLVITEEQRKLFAIGLKHVTANGSTGHEAQLEAKKILRSIDNPDLPLSTKGTNDITDL